MFKIQFDTDNAAFAGEDRTAEIARILFKIANAYEDGAQTLDGQPIHDLNGNRIGEVKDRR